MVDENARASARLGAALLCVLSLALLTCLMGSKGHFSLSVPVGFGLAAAAALGLLSLFGASDALASAMARELDARRLGLCCLILCAALTLWVVVLRLAVAGVLPLSEFAAAILVPAVFLVVVVAAVRVGEALGFSEPRPLTARPGFWLMLLHAVVYLPLLGSYSLVDPWETHYGEVAREVLARDDWLSLWWAQDGWFWSKPVLTFWLQGLSFSLLGVEFWPDRMLSGIALGHTPHPEWAARLPVFLMTALASYSFYKAVGRWVHARAGLLSALVLSTTPYWFLISHQSITDMPYVAALVACLSFFLLGLASDPEAKSEPRRLRLGRTEFVFSAAHALFFLVLCCALPQICYLISRNLTLDLASGVLDVHSDVFMAGSGGGNCGLPGNAACLRVGPLHRFWQPVLLALLWLFLLLILVKRGVTELRLRPLLYLCAWLCLSLSAMAKGAPGLVLPLFVIVVFLAATRRWKELLELRPLGLVLIFAVVVLPWYVQVVARHGSAFLERLLLHDMYKRAFDHVHDTNDGVDVSFRYYLWQLGYGLFPWSGVAAAAVLDWAREQPGSDETSPAATSQQLRAFCALWFIATFALFTLSGTKFHHYILPAVPALAGLSGVWLHELCESSAPTRYDWRYLTGLCLATSGVLVGVTLSKGGPIDGLVRQVGDDGWAAPITGGLLLVCAGAVAFFTLRHASRAEPASGEPRVVASGMLALVAALGTGLVARDFLTAHGERLPGQVLLMQLFSYQYKRPWPESLEFSGALFAFGLVASVFCLGLAHQRSRMHAAIALSALATLWAAWGIDLYLVRAAPHWGQRETIAAYYRARRSADPPLVAYQMNWKGENFYTGNRVAAFVKSGEPFQKWIDAQRRRGIRTLFFTTEPSRFGALKRELGSFQRFEVLTLPSLNNKFALAKVDL